MIEQLIQLTGAMLILAAYTAGQFKWLDPHSRVYLVMNLVGSAVLTVLAFRLAQWGFVLLEGVWAIVSFAGLLRSVTTEKRVNP